MTQDIVIVGAATAFIVPPLFAVIIQYRFILPEEQMLLTDIATEVSRHDTDQSGCEDVYSIVAEQDQADQSIGSLQEFFGKLGAAMARTSLMAQFVSIEAHECRFRAREERGKQQ